MFIKNVSRYLLELSRVVQMLGGAAVYARGGAWGCFVRILDMYLQYGSRLGPCGAGKSCEGANRTCVIEVGFQLLMVEVMRGVFVVKANSGLQYL